MRKVYNELIMNNQSRALRWSIILGIMIVANLFIGFSLSLIYKAPIFTNFCPTSQINVEPMTKSACLASGGQWNAYSAAPAGKSSAPTIIGSCNTQYTCQKAFDTAQQSFELKVFVTLIILGALLVLIGNLTPSNDVLSVSLSLAGVLAFIIASIRYWSYASDYIHVGILAIALAILLWIAYKKFRNAGIQP